MASEPLGVVIAVDADVESVLRSELLHHVFNILHATSTQSHGFGRVVGVAARSIPVGEELGSERHRHVEVFGNTT